MKKIIAISLMIIAVVIALSMSTVLMIENNSVKKQLNSSDLLSQKINDIVSESYNTYGQHKNEKYDNYISDKNFSKLCFRIKDSSIKNEFYTGKVTQLEYDGDNARAVYEYTYTAYDEDGTIITSSGVPEPIPVIIELKYGDINKNDTLISCWGITDVFEYP